MQLITLFVSSIAVFGIHAAIVPADAHNERGGVFTKRDQGLCSYDGDCIVNGVRKTCQIGACSEEGSPCDDDVGIVSCT
ncbi:hypothetical protein DL769_005288 [Monosporascus sp. CRB-8-3]|nr:hypothetical protein DL769_005288 [Monosporascus sp. CRB-8-3]